MKTVLLVVNGLGLGNSTRCDAVIQHLVAAGIRVEVVTSGNGLYYFRDRPEIAALHEADSWQYRTSRRGNLSVALTALAVGNLVRAYVRASQQVEHLLRTRSVDMVVLDSAYVFAPIHRRGIPIVALNNSDVVVSQVFGQRRCPRDILLQFFLVELLDYLFHRTVPTAVVSPRLNEEWTSSDPRFLPVGPIVRAPFLTANPPGELKRICVMLSGSGFGTHVAPRAWGLPYPVDVLGGTGESGDGVRFHGRVRDSFSFLSAAQLLVINGGFSAVSEAYALRRVTVVVPVARHAEQYQNARALETAGIGVIASADSIGDGVRRAVAGYERYREAGYRLPPVRDGSLEAAKAILERLG